ncbi:hypothetical protein Dsin_021313 [Dipteronia sinensis]|uniref:Reverse transcriptase domain-containing protein n=1 Tax=Dipteronia sinensis TaxID=43782 RepID=A0AAD9ZZH7_9ROSI|nr:hypothetical protein Dsin_021313 [Dipteronia sinensis]
MLNIPIMRANVYQLSETWTNQATNAIEGGNQAELSREGDLVSVLKTVEEGETLACMKSSIYQTRKEGSKNCYSNKKHDMQLKVEEEERKRVLRSLGGSFLTRGVGVDAVGSVGGLISLWNEVFFIFKSSESNNRCIILVEELIIPMKDVVLCNVYASNVEMKERNCGTSLLGLKPRFPCLGVSDDTSTRCLILEDFMRFIKEFHGDSSNIKDLNRTFIALIPKTGKPNSMKDFRPISLVGLMYKMLAKVLANRMKKVMESIIEDTQMAFVKTQQIMDSFIIANEINHS